MDMKVVEASVSTSAEVKQATESLIGKVDAFYIITDNTVVSALESVISVANDNEIPMMVGEFDSVKRGGLGHMDLTTTILAMKLVKWLLRF